MEKSSHLKQCINWITEVEERGYRQSLPVYGDFDNVSIIRPSPINTPFLIGLTISNFTFTVTTQCLKS